MKKNRQIGTTNHSQADHPKSRKDLRKEKKLQKKQRKRHYFQAKSQPTKQLTHTSKGPSSKQPSSNSLKRPAATATTTPSIAAIKKQTQAVTKKALKAVETEDDKMIKLCEQKLGISKGKDKYSKIAKKFEFDDDLFDFLDGISKKVQGGHQYKGEQLEHEDFQIEDDNQQNDMDDEIYKEGEEEGDMDCDNEEFDREYDEMFENLDQLQPGMYEQADEEGMQDEEQDYYEAQEHHQEGQDGLEPEQQPAEQERQSVPNNKGRPNILSKPQNQAQIQVQQRQITRAMNRHLNKLSDGNILLTFRQFLTILDNYPKSTAIPIYAQAFTKFNLLIEKPLFHILATNVALLVALHYAVGNRLMAPVMHYLTQQYLKINSQPDNQEEVAQLGYSKKFERLKNYATIISLLYNYKAVSGEYVQSYVHQLTESLNKSNIELIYILIQKSGAKIRQNDPSTLKNIMNNIKDAIEDYKRECNNDEEQLQKIKFIQLQLNDIRFNKKDQNAIDQRMAFLQTFIQKNIQKEVQKEKEIFPLNYEQLVKADTSRTLWWEHQDNNRDFPQVQQDQIEQEYDIEVTKEKRQLLELAKAFHMVTENKKNIFICLMDSKDYIEATQRILQLNVKHQQDIATVLVEVCTLEPNFNPYYPLVAAKIAGLIPKFRLNLQYAIWDHLKLIPQYQLRRTINLAKFTAKLISDPVANCSLSILKFYPDLTNVKTIDTVFLNSCFTHFFKKIKTQYLNKLVAKLREQNNRDVKLSIKQFLVDFECPSAIKDKVKLCRRLLMVEVDERKMEMGDD